MRLQQSARVADRTGATDGLDIGESNGAYTEIGTRNGETRTCMSHSLDLNAAQAVHTLRLLHEPQAEPGLLRLSPHAYFAWDAEGGTVELTVEPELGLLLHAEARVSGTPEWLCFNLELQWGALEPGSALGIVAEFEGCAGEDLPVFIRSSRDGALFDTHLAEALHGSDERSVQSILHWVSAEDPMAGEPAYHTLVIPLPGRDFRLELRDLRVFVRPPADGGH